MRRSIYDQVASKEVFTLNIQNSGEQNIFTSPPENEPRRGYLTVRAATARGAIPLVGAAVTVRGSQIEDSGIRAAAITGRDGLTPRFSLAVPPRENSESPGNSEPYYTYHIEVSKDGYRTQNYYNVPVFEGISALQTAELVPLPENGVPDRFTLDDGRVYEIETLNSREGSS